MKTSTLFQSGTSFWSLWSTKDLLPCWKYVATTRISLRLDFIVPNYHVEDSAHWHSSSSFTNEFWIMHATIAYINCSALYVFLIHMLLQLIICVLKINLSLGEHLLTYYSKSWTSSQIFSIGQTVRVDHLSFMWQQ